MKVAIVAPSAVPHVLGGAERLWDGLRSTIQSDTPHDCELFKLPVREANLPDLIASYRAFSRLDLSHFDLVISSKYPAWMVQHPNHAVYLQHTLRGLYDTYPANLPLRVDASARAVARVLRAMDADPQGDDLDGVFGALESAVAELGREHPALRFPGPLARRLVHHLDRVALSPRRMRRHLAISATVAGRPGYFPPGVPVQVVHHPSNLAGLHDRRQDFLFTASRLDAPKRIHLMVEAMRLLPAGARLRIAGTGLEADRLRALAGPDARIELLGHVSESQLVQLYADSLAVLFVPRDEDLGLITLEAFGSGKPVVTADDSGGATELVVDGVSGRVVAPTAEALAGAVRPLLSDPSLARSMGDRGRAAASRVTWRGTVNALLGSGTALPNRPPRRAARPRVLVLSTFPVHPRLGGGQLRCHHLYGALSHRFDVEILSLAGPDHPAQLVQLGDGYWETVIPISTDHHRAEHGPTAAVGISISDILASSLVHLTPAYLEALARSASQATAAVLAHPYLLPALEAVGAGLPVIYDAHNAELELKRGLLPENATAARLLASVREVEGRATRTAMLVTACSEGDSHALARAYGVDAATIVLVPNGVDASSHAMPPLDRRRRDRRAWLEAYARAGMAAMEPAHLAVFMGSWHPPNVAAVRRAIEVTAARPDLVLAVLGSVGSAFASWRVPDNVSLLGNVSESAKRVILDCSDVSLNPMISGSGTNLKTLEYMAAGAPLVSSPIGVRGLPIRDGVEALVVAPERTAEGVERVLARPDDAAAMAVRARAFVERDYDWSVIGARFTDAVEAALSRRAAPAA